MNLEKYAKLLVEYCNNVKSGERVLISGPSAAIPLMDLIYEECVKVGAHVHAEIEESGSMNGSFYEYATEEQLKYVPKWKYDQLDEFDCYFGVWGDDNTKANTNADLVKQRLRDRYTKDLEAKWDKLTDSEQIRWVVCLYPTNAYAQDAEMSLSEYEDFVFRACKLHLRHPKAAWKKLKREQQKIVDYLDTASRIQVLAPGTDLRLSVKGRKWINCFGTDNMPDGEVFTGPVESSVEGKIAFTYPAVYDGHEVENVRLTFKKGKVVRALASKGQDFLKSTLDTDRGSRYVGEFAFGLNKDVQKFTKEVLFDEKIGGTLHLALGNSYASSGGINQSSVHWDMVCDLRKDSKVYVDRKIFMVNGQIVVDL